MLKRKLSDLLVQHIKKQRRKLTAYSAVLCQKFCYFLVSSEICLVNKPHTSRHRTLDSQGATSPDVLVNRSPVVGVTALRVHHGVHHARLGYGAGERYFSACDHNSFRFKLVL